MIRVLIADDEKRIRDGLEATIPWDSLGMAVIGTAAHGEAALELARQTEPHIILTDVRMPRMDGLEFLRQVKAFLPRVKVVILSGYDDFSYAQQAVKLGVSDYLVKPVGTEEIVRTLTNLRESLERAGDRPEPSRPSGPVSSSEPLAAAVLRGDPAAAFAALGEWRLENAGGDVASVRTQSLGLVDELVQDLRREGFEFRAKDSPASAEGLSTVLGATTRPQIDAWLDSQVGALAEFVRRNYLNNHTRVVRQALELIESRFSGDLTLEVVAAAVGLSPNYFSHLFKKVTGRASRTISTWSGSRRHATCWRPAGSRCTRRRFRWASRTTSTSARCSKRSREPRPPAISGRAQSRSSGPRPFRARRTRARPRRSPVTVTTRGRPGSRSK
jgi:two-component system response regulator YesN